MPDLLDTRRMRQLLDAVTSLGSDLELEAVLQRVAEAAVELVGARYGALGVIDDRHEGLAEFVAVGVDEATRAAIGAPPKGLGLLGAVIREGAAMRTDSIRGHKERSGFPPHHPPMESFLGVPIRVGDAVFGNLYLAEKVNGEPFEERDEEVAAALASAAALAIGNARLYSELRGRSAALAALQEVTGAVLGGLGRTQSLELIARHARALLDGVMATVALPQPDGETLIIEAADGALWEGAMVDPFPVEGSISGQVLREGATIVVDDAAADDRISQPQVRIGDIGPAVWTPLTAGGKPFGTLFVGRGQKGRPLTSQELELVRSFAAQASVVLDRDRARQDRQRLAVLEDQERIARDLHDSVIQRLFATGMSLHGASRMIADPTALQRVTAAVDELDVTIRHIRTVIFGLEESGQGQGSGVRSAVLGLCREASRILGFEPIVTFDGPIDALVDEHTADELLAVLREAVSNVVRHAHAEHIEVDITASGGRLLMRVVDDGVGMSEEVAAKAGGRGLRNMRVRAERLGGDLTLRSVPDGGAELLWHVPILAP